MDTGWGQLTLMEGNFLVSCHRCPGLRPLVLGGVNASRFLASEVGGRARNGPCDRPTLISAAPSLRIGPHPTSSTSNTVCPHGDHSTLRQQQQSMISGHPMRIFGPPSPPSSFPRVARCKCTTDDGSFIFAVAESNTWMLDGASLCTQRGACMF